MYSSNRLKIENALAYARLGWSVFPCNTVENGGCSCGDPLCKNVAKHPLTKNGVKDAAKDATNLANYFGGNYAIANIAVATGEPSGVWVIDVDDLDALTTLEQQHGTLPKTPMVETGRGGRHYYFRWTQALANLKNAVKFSGALDVRTTGGYVLLPPSVHASGKEYRWLISPDETPVADAPDWLIALIPKHQTLTISAGITVDERVTKYLAECPPAISGHGGHGHTFGVVCRLLETFPELRERDADDLLKLLESWNVRCVPPWTDSELRHKIVDAAARAAASNVTSVSTSTITLTPTPPPTVKINDDDNGSITMVEDLVADEWPVLQPDALYGFAGDFIRFIEPFSETDSVALLLTFHVAFGSCIGRAPYIRIGGDWHYVNLYACIVGASARARKGMSLGYILDLFSGIDSAWMDHRVNGLSSGEGVIQAVRDADVEADKDKFTVVGGVTDKRLWITETEFGQTLKVLKREGNTLSAVLRNGWDRGELHVLTRREPLKASNAHISILGHITRDELHRYMDATDLFNGFANRFVWALVKRSKLLPDGKTPPLDAWRKRLAAITQKAKMIGEMQRSPAANELWREVYPILVAEKRGLWDAATGRAEAQTLRLSMLYALLDGSSTIDVPHLRAALALWRYCDESARLIFTPDANESEGGTLEAKIRRIVRERPGIMRTPLRDAISHKLKASELERALTWLAGRGEIERRTSTVNGKSCECLYPVEGNVAGSTSVSTLTAIANVAAPPIPDAPLPRCPAAPDVDGVKVSGGNGATAMTPTEFIEGISQTPVEMETETTATLTELLEWKNANGVSFVRRGDGVVWVTNEDGLTASLTAAISAHQETLRMLAPSNGDGKRVGGVDKTDDEIADKDFFQDLLDM